MGPEGIISLRPLTSLEKNPMPNLIVTDRGLDPDKLLFEGVEVGAPYLSIGEVCKAVLGRSQHWLRLAETKLGIQTPRTDGGARQYSLSYLESLLHAMADARMITVDDLRNSLIVVKHIAILHGVLPDDAAIRTADHS